MASRETAARTLISPARLNRPGAKRFYWALVIAIVVIFSLVFLVPLYWMFTGGLKTGAEYAQNPPILYPHTPQWGNYSRAWTQLHIGRLLFNTTLYAFGALAFQLVFDVAAAYAFSKLRPFGGNLILGLMLITLMIPSTVLIIPQYLTVINLPLLHLDLINTPWVIWLPAVTNAFNIFLLKRFFDSIPNDLMAAAAIDGASALRTLRSIILPMSRPILGVVAIFSVTATWKDFLWPLLTEPATNNHTVNVGIVAFSSAVPQNVIIAAAVIAAVPTVIFFLVFQRNIMSGLTTGSLKG